jgi:hypothetical protein
MTGRSLTCLPLPFPGPWMAPPYFNTSGITSSLLYVQSDAEITFLGNEPDHQEILITSMEISETGISEDRIAALEKRLREMEALVNGLIDELLDFKAVAKTMSRQSEERSRQELKQGPVVRGTSSPATSSPSVAASTEPSTIIRPRGARQPDVPAAPAEPEMVRIMQTDGTMKMEPRWAAGTIDSSSGYGRNKMGLAAKEKQAPLIYAADEEKSKK